MRVTAIQLEINEKETLVERVSRVKSIIQNLPETDLIMLPELWACGFFDFENYEKSADHASEIISMLSEAAKAKSCMIISSIVVKDTIDSCAVTDASDSPSNSMESEKSEDYSKSYRNASILFGPDGTQAARYDKIHLFGYESREPEILTPGRSTVVTDTPFGKIGIATCYDLRFPEQFRKMSAEGAEIFLVVADWPLARLSHWQLFNQARALENQCFLLSCNASGTYAGTVQGGHSMAVSPYGEVLAEAGTAPEILSYCINPKDVKEARAAFPFLHDKVEI